MFEQYTLLLDDSIDEDSISSENPSDQSMHQAPRCDSRLGVSISVDANRDGVIDWQEFEVEHKAVSGAHSGASWDRAAMEVAPLQNRVAALQDDLLKARKDAQHYREAGPPDVESRQLCPTRVPLTLDPNTNPNAHCRPAKTTWRSARALGRGMLRFGKVRSLP